MIPTDNEPRALADNGAAQVLVEVRRNWRHTLRRLTAADLDVVDLVDALELRAELRAARGFQRRPAPMLTGDGNAKLRKGATRTVGLSLLPHTMGGATLCAWSTGGPQGCQPPNCLESAGHGAWTTTNAARAARLDLVQQWPAAAMALVRAELRALVDRHPCQLLAYRHNVLSDTRPGPWLAELLDELPELLAYDYTKEPPDQWRADGVDRTYSVSNRETTAAAVLELLVDGARIAVVTRWRPAPGVRTAVPVIDGDASDERFRDPAPAVVLLTPKGKMRSVPDDVAGMVKPAEMLEEVTAP